MKAIGIFLLVAILLGAGFAGGLAFMRWRGAQDAAAITERKVLYWVDPMHPAYKSDKPGVAPDCGMKLEPVYADDTRTDLAAGGGLLNVSPEQQRLIGVQYGQAELTASSNSFRAVGKVAQDETR